MGKDFKRIILYFCFLLLWGGKYYYSELYVCGVMSWENKGFIMELKYGF